LFLVLVSRPPYCYPSENSERIRVVRSYRVALQRLGGHSRNRLEDVRHTKNATQTNTTRRVIAKTDYIFLEHVREHNFKYVQFLKLSLIQLFWFVVFNLCSSSMSNRTKKNAAITTEHTPAICAGSDSAPRPPPDTLRKSVQSRL